MKKTALLFSFLLTCALAGAQPVVGDDDYETEITWGVNKNTTGGLIGGVVFKLARRSGENLFTIYGLELMNVKHPKEQRYPSQTSGTIFVWGKENYLYSIRGIYGKERLIFKKAPQQGVQISGIVGAGPTLGIIAPYYILYNGKYVPYSAEKHGNGFGSIQGAGKLFQGLDESRITFGLNAKAGIGFEFGAFKNNVAGVEVGIAAEAFPQEIIIVPTQENRAVFTSFYFSMVWGTRR